MLGGQHLVVGGDCFVGPAEHRAQHGAATVYHDWSNGDDKAAGDDWVNIVVEVKHRVLPSLQTAQVIWTSFPDDRFGAWQGTSCLAPIIAASLATNGTISNPHAADRI